MIVEENLRNLVLDTRVYRSFGLDTDHYLVASKLRIKKGVPSNYQKPTNRVKVEKLKDENVASEFVSKLENKFTQIEMNEANDIEHEWSVFKKVILETAKECCGTYVCKNVSGRKKSEFWNDEIKAAVKEKRVRWLKWMQNRNDESLEAYRVQKRVVKRCVKEAKEKGWVKFGKDLEEAGQQRNKVFWSKVKKIRNGGNKQYPGSVLSKSGDLVLGKKNVLKRWKEYFNELLNVENAVSENVDTNESVNAGMNAEQLEGISEDEIRMTLRKLSCGKAAGVDEIRNEYLICSGLVGLRWLHRIFNLAFKTSVVPKD